MFAEDVILSDWDVRAEGKEAVLEANKNIFQSVHTINVIPYFYYVGEEGYAVEIDVIINADQDTEEVLQVVDIISFILNIFFVLDCFSSGFLCCCFGLYGIFRISGSLFSFSGFRFISRIIFIIY